MHHLWTLLFQTCSSLRPDISPPRSRCLTSSRNICPRQVARTHQAEPISASRTLCARPAGATQPPGRAPAPPPGRNTTAASTAGAANRAECTPRAWALRGCPPVPPSTAPCPCLRAWGAGLAGVTPRAARPAGTRPRTWCGPFRSTQAGCNSLKGRLNIMADSREG